MKKFAIALIALAGIMFMAGCAYDYYPYYYGHYAYGYGWPSYSRFGYPYYGSRLGGWDCVHNFNTLYCGRV